MKKIITYCTVGSIAMVVDISVFVILSENVNLSFTLSRLLAFAIAASTTWLGNRYLTFSTATRQGPIAQVTRHFCATALALCFNLTFCSLLLLNSYFHKNEVQAVFIGIVLTTALNFYLSKTWVFSPSAETLNRSHQ